MPNTSTDVIMPSLYVNKGVAAILFYRHFIITSGNLDFHRQYLNFVQNSQDNEYNRTNHITCGVPITRCVLTLVD